MLDANLGTLRDSVIHLLESLTAKITPKKQSHIFMINSLDLILNTFISAKMVDVEDYRVLKRLLDSYVTKFIEDELEEYYGKMIAFIKVAEGQVSKNSTHLQVCRNNFNLTHL
jgi:hypothetical protein